MTKNREQQLRIDLDPKLFMDRVECHAGLRDLIRDSVAIVSVKDITNLVTDKEGEVRIEKLSERSFLSILRAINGCGDVQIYKDAAIELQFTELSYAAAHQTFAEVGKLANINSFNTLLKSTIGMGVSSAPPLVITYQNSNEKYIAFYMPPIIEVMQKQKFGKILERVKERIRYLDELQLSPVDGVRPLGLNVLYERARQMLSESSELTIPIIVDGTHRVIASAITGSSRTSYNSILINGSKRNASSMPIRIEDIVFTHIKPARKEDRFAGIDEEGWIRFKDVGIDN